jgi:hypothetical protein
MSSETRSVFAVDRRVFDHPMFAREPFTEREAWVWLIAEAAWRPCRKRTGSAIISLARGELSHSIRFMAEAWQWHRARVERFLGRLKTETMVRTRVETGVTVISICKYAEYQRVSLPPETLGETPNETAARQQRDRLEDRETTEQDSVADATGEPRSPKTLDPKTLLFRDGLATLAKLAGRKPDALRPVIGRWMKLTGDDAGALLAEIERCRGSPVADPISSIEARLKPRDQNGKSRRITNAEQSAAAMAWAINRANGADERQAEFAEPDHGDETNGRRGGKAPPAGALAHGHGTG